MNKVLPEKILYIRFSYAETVNAIKQADICCKDYLSYCQNGTKNSLCKE